MFNDFLRLFQFQFRLNGQNGKTFIPFSLKLQQSKLERLAPNFNATSYQCEAPIRNAALSTRLGSKLL
jgi:hypothetical protein